MDAPGIDIDTGPHPEGLFLRRVVLGVRDGELAFEDEVGGEAAMSVWAVVGISRGGAV